MTQIQESDIISLANLARISLTSEEVVMFTKDIQSIVGFIDVVNNTEVSDELLKQDGFAPVNKTRVDEECQTDYMSPQDIIKAAPNHQDNAVKVKKIIGGDDN
jgi:aspartyl-tRNA(Asn)/glutamyl-tRNA(Gln) amidotransferase subunit C